MDALGRSPHPGRDHVNPGVSPCLICMRASSGPMLMPAVTGCSPSWRGWTGCRRSRRSSGAWQRAIGELARVVRPGGRVVAFELDYGATLVDLPDRGAAQRVLDALGCTVAHRWMGRALARAVEAGTLEAHAFRQWLAAAQDAERGGYHSDTFVGMVVSARKPGPGRAAIAR